MCRRVHGCKLFARPQPDADTILHVAADAKADGPYTDVSFLGRQLHDARNTHLMNVDFQFRFWSQVTILYRPNLYNS